MTAAEKSRHRLVARAPLFAFVCAAVLVVLCAAVAFDVERDDRGANIKTFWDALWWAITTIATVGYGDRFPVTGGGRAVAAVLMLTGIALIGVVTASIAAWFVNLTRPSIEPSEDKLSSDIDALRADFVALNAVMQRLIERLDERLDVDRADRVPHVSGYDARRTLAEPHGQTHRSGRGEDGAPAPPAARPASA